MVRSTSPHHCRIRRRRRVIEGVPRLTFSTASNSVIKALAVALQFRGESWTYEQLMGLSGAAFRLQISRNGWCPSSPHACCGYPCAQSVQTAIGYELQPIRFENDNPASLGDARRQITYRIDSGELVLFGSEEEGLIVGYEDAGAVLLVRHPSCKTDTYEAMKDWPWGFSTLERTGPPLDKLTRLREALQRALELAKDGLYDGYDLGLGVYDRWTAELEDDNCPEVRSGKGSNGNAWIYQNLVDARRAAAVFLRAGVGASIAAVDEHLLHAADLYARIPRVLTDDQCSTLVAPYAWSLKDDQRWTRPMRLDQARRLTEARQLEQAAVKHLAHALRLLPA